MNMAEVTNLDNEYKTTICINDMNTRAERAMKADEVHEMISVMNGFGIICENNCQRSNELQVDSSTMDNDLSGSNSNYDEGSSLCENIIIMDSVGATHRDGSMHETSYNISGPLMIEKCNGL